MHYHYGHGGVQCCAGNYNHRKCAKEFWKNRSGVSFENDDAMKADQSSHSSIKHRLPGKAFNFHLNCMFCGTFISSPISIADGISMVQAMRLQRSIHRIANSKNDCWGRAVAGRINRIVDLPAADHDTTIHVAPISEQERTYPINIQIIQKEENLVDQWMKRSKMHSIKYLFIFFIIMLDI